MAVAEEAWVEGWAKAWGVAEDKVADRVEGAWARVAGAVVAWVLRAIAVDLPARMPPRPHLKPWAGIRQERAERARKVTEWRQA